MIFKAKLKKTGEIIELYSFFDCLYMCNRFKKLNTNETVKEEDFVYISDESNSINVLEVYKKRLKELSKESTSEEGGMEADGLIYNILIELGHKDIAEDFIKVDKWYA